MKIIIPILIVGIFAGIIAFLSLKITTFEECERSGWLVRGIRIYDGSGSAEKECFLWIGKSFTKQRTPSDQNLQPNWEAKIDDQASVTITVAPSDISRESKEWKFNVVMDTHSVELSQDMAKIALLMDDKGKEYKPLRWDGSPAGGHHREGMLVFAPIMPYPQHLELIIKNIGNVERSFSWILFENNK